MAFKTFLNFLCFLRANSFRPFDPSIHQMLPLLFHFQNDTWLGSSKRQFCSDEDLQKQCKNCARQYASCVMAAEDVPLVLELCRKVPCLGQCAFQMLLPQTWWKARVSLLKFLQISIFANFFVLQKFRDHFRHLLLVALQDEQIEVSWRFIFNLQVRQAASETLSGLFQCRFIEVDTQMIVGQKRVRFLRKILLHRQK